MEQSKEISCFEVLWLFSFERFSLMKALALGTRTLQFLIKKYKVFCSAVKYFQFLDIQTLNPELDPQFEKGWIRFRIKSIGIRNPISNF
jgi:hypothetical protein